MQCNASKTVYMVFPPKDKRKTVASVLPSFVLNGVALRYVYQFKYVEHIISNDNTDDKDALLEAHEQIYLIIDLVCVLYPSKSLCFGHFVFVFMG